ncbi:hypothetical protein AB0395_46260 [Streptosporangium sp. NPDC051023]|uniref:hypothetical protein n=1 Tax=Streptosporangium sp. NPDC051023 TaxID=3155410 RepID=UPI00344E4FDC
MAAIVLAVAIAVVLLTVWGAWRGVKAAGRGIKTSNTAGEDLLTWVAALIATGVSAQGMWRFAGDVLGFDGPLRVMLFAFIEVAMFTSAVRARRNMRENYSAGIDGLAVWALTCLSAVLSSMDARSLPEAVFRLSAPLVAAWLWERGMAIQRHRATGRKRINWRLTPERMLVRVGLAEVSDRTASEVDAHRRLKRVGLAAKRLYQLRQTGASARKIQAAVAKRDRTLDRAVEHTNLAQDEATQKALLDIVSAYGGGDSLSTVLENAVAPWSDLDHPALVKPRQPGTMPPGAEAVQAALAQWTRETVRDPGLLLDVQDASNSATTPATTSLPVMPAPQRRVFLSPGDPRPTGRLVPFVTWTRPEVHPFEGELLLPPMDAEVDAEMDATNDVDGEWTRPDGDQDADRPEPTEQDKRRVARWWAGRVEKGEYLSKWALAERSGFKPTWCGDRITEGKEILAAKGWNFDDRGRPVKPAPAIEVDAELVASTASLNGSKPSA